METSVCCHWKQIYLEKQNIGYLKTSHFGNAACGIKSFKGLNTVTEKSQKFSRASAFSRIFIWKISEIASKSVRFETGNCIGKEFHWNCNGKERGKQHGENVSVIESILLCYRNDSR